MAMANVEDIKAIHNALFKLKEKLGPAWSVDRVVGLISARTGVSGNTVRKLMREFASDEDIPKMQTMTLEVLADGIRNEIKDVTFVRKPLVF